MIPLSDVACPRCGEDRATLISEVIDPTGKQFYCCVCSYSARSFRTADHSTNNDTNNAGDLRPPEIL